MHVPTKPTKGGFLTFRLNVNGVMLGATISICQAPLFFAIIMANPKVWPSSIFQLVVTLCESGRVLSLTRNMASH